MHIQHSPSSHGFATKRLPVQMSVRNLTILTGFALYLRLSLQILWQYLKLGLHRACPQNQIITSMEQWLSRKRAKCLYQGTGKMSIPGNRQNVYTREHAKCLYQGTGKMSIPGNGQKLYIREHAKCLYQGKSKMYIPQTAKMSVQQ